MTVAEPIVRGAILFPNSLCIILKLGERVVYRHGWAKFAAIIQMWGLIWCAGLEAKLYYYYYAARGVLALHNYTKPEGFISHRSFG